MWNFNKLFTPYNIGKMEVKNRIVMSPMGTNSSNADGTITDDVINYFAARAKGGVGLIIMGVQYMSIDLDNATLEGVLADNYVIPKLGMLSDAVHRYDAKIAAQIGCGTGRNQMPKENCEILSSSALPNANDPSFITRPMTKEEIHRIVEQYRKAASIVRKAGFDAIEIHAHVGYLLDQFMSMCWNKREDEYGGSIENRMRLPIEIVQAIKEENGKDFPVIYRMCLSHCFEGGRTIEEGQAIIKELEKGGVDAVDLDAGAYESFEYIFPPSYMGDACLEFVCKPARQAVNIPILNAGNHTPETAVNLIESGNADFVMFGRPLIADPDLPLKLMQRRPQDIRPCIRCNEGCIGKLMQGLKAGCSVNPQANEEIRLPLIPTANKKKIVVIGAGPAGLESARVLSLRGHEVTIYEKENVIGGQLAAAATPSFKKQLANLLKWYSIQLEKQGVEIKFNHEITADSPVLDTCDNIIVAAGAKPICPPIPGIHGQNVIGVIEAHQNKALVKGDHIVVCGGGLSGCDFALELAMDQKKPHVTILEMTDQIAPNLFLSSYLSLMNKLNEYNVTLKSGTKVLSFSEEGIEVEKDGQKSLINADTVIIAFGMERNAGFAETIMEKYRLKTRCIGDCVSVAKIGEAIKGGYFAGISID